MDFIPNVYFQACPTRKVLNLIADKWTALIVGVLAERPHRFSEMLRNIEGISQKMLTQTLRNLERHGLAKRTVYPEVPPRVEYQLTTLGRTLNEPMSLIRTWAEANIQEIMAAQARFEEK